MTLTPVREAEIRDAVTGRGYPLRTWIWTEAVVDLLAEIDRLRGQETVQAAAHWMKRADRLEQAIRDALDPWSKKTWKAILREAVDEDK